MNNNFTSESILAYLESPEHRRVINYYVKSDDLVYLTKRQLKLLRDVLVLMNASASLTYDIFSRTYTSANVKHVIDTAKDL